MSPLNFIAIFGRHRECRRLRCDGLHQDIQSIHATIDTDIFETIRFALSVHALLFGSWCSSANALLRAQSEKLNGAKRS